MDAPFPHRVLVVDDDPDVLELVGLFLEGENYSVTFAPNGREALRLFREQPFNVVISDGNMPEMSGDELAMAIKHLFPGTPIILISGHHWACVDPAHFDGFVPKPFSRMTLLEVIRAALAGILLPHDDPPIPGTTV